MSFIYMILIIIGFIALTSIREVKEHERGVKFVTGKFYKVVRPGWHIVWPIFQSMKKVDIRTVTVDVPSQEVITKDNVSIRINAVLYYSIFDAAKALIEVQKYQYAVSNLAQTTMRNVVGGITLDQLLTERETISESIRTIVDELTDPWGIKVENVELKDISLPEEMQRVLAKGAEAEREKIAIYTKAAGEVESAKKLAEAAQILSTSPSALHLRTLSTLNDISSDKSNTLVFAIPIEMFSAFKNK